MNYAALANPGVLNQPVYEPGKPIEDVAREHGLDPKGIAKLASNENPFGPSPLAVAAAREALASAHLYPDGACLRLRARLAQRHGLGMESIVVGNGSNELIELLGHVFMRPGSEAVMGERAFIVYWLVSKLFGAQAVTVPMRTDYAHDLDAMAAAISERTRLVFVASPNNPTGPANSPAEIESFIKALPPHVICVMDEAYAEYLDEEPDIPGLIKAGYPVVGMRTFSKIFGLGGLRIGYGYAHPELASLMQRVRQPFNVNSIAQVAALAALDDHAFIEQCKRANAEGREQLVAGVQALGLEVVPGDANFVLVRCGDGTAAFKALQANGMIVRPLAAYGMPDAIRVTIGKVQENERFLQLLEAHLQGSLSSAKTIEA
jgi:histidinol-phosphate aminotransferase